MLSGPRMTTDATKARLLADKTTLVATKVRHLGQTQRLFGLNHPLRRPFMRLLATSGRHRETNERHREHNGRRRSTKGRHHEAHGRRHETDGRHRETNSRRPASKLPLPQANGRRHIDQRSTLRCHEAAPRDQDDAFFDDEGTLSQRLRPGIGKAMITRFIPMAIHSRRSSDVTRRQVAPRSHTCPRCAGAASRRRCPPPGTARAATARPGLRGQ